MIQTTSVIGLGKLGACMASCFASKGFHTIGVDVDPDAVAAVNDGRAPVEETDLQATMSEGRGFLSATEDYRQAVLGSDVTFVIVPTPSDAQGGFSLEIATAAFREIGQALAEKDSYHLVVLTSTVLPGATGYALRPVLEEASGKKVGDDFGLCYSPEFIALGSVIRDFLNPDFVLVGQSDDRAGALLEAFYKRVCANNPPIERMGLVNAELTKMSVNSFMTMRISFANMLSALCESLPGGDVDVVTHALSLFGGVGTKALRGGLGYGGPCLPRDNVALSYLARSLGAEIPLPAVVDQFNRSLVSRLANIVVRHTGAGRRIAVLGLSYKPLTSVIEESPGLDLAKLLSESGLQVIAYDPTATAVAEAVLPTSVRFAESVDEAIREADTVVLTTPDPAFRLLPSLLAAQDRPICVIDPWRFLKEERDRGEFTVATYVPLGIGPPSNSEIEVLLRGLA